MLAALALVLAQDQSQVSQIRRTAGFVFPPPAPEVLVTESANGQVYFVELRRSGQEAAPPYLKLFSLPNPDGAVDAAALFGLSDEEFAGLAASSALTAAPATDGVLALPGGDAACRSQSFAGADGSTVARARAVILQTAPMAAGALIWQGPGQPESLLSEAEALLAGLKVLPFTADTLVPGQQAGIDYAVPLLWTQQNQAQPLGFTLSCQGPIGSVFVMGGQPSLFGGDFGEGLVLDSQRGEADQLAANFGGAIIRQDGLLRLLGEQLHVGQRFLMKLSDGSVAEIRNAIFSNDDEDICMIGGLYTWAQRPAMVAILDRMLPAVGLPNRPQQEMETRAWSGLAVRFPERLRVEERDPGPLLAGGWTFTIPHDEHPENHSFELRIVREAPPAAARDAQQELLASVTALSQAWPGSTVQDSVASAGTAFGHAAAVLRATVIVDGVPFLVDARRAATARGVYQSLAYFPADLEADHRPVLEFILERSSLWEEGRLATSCGVGVPALAEGWRLRDYRDVGGRDLLLSDQHGGLIHIEAAPELDAGEDLEAALKSVYGSLGGEDASVTLQVGGRSVPALESITEPDEEDGQAQHVELHAVVVLDGRVWHLVAAGPLEQRPQILAVVAGLRLPGAER